MEGFTDNGLPLLSEGDVKPYLVVADLAEKVDQLTNGVSVIDVTGAGTLVATEEQCLAATLVLTGSYTPGRILELPARTWRKLLISQATPSSGATGVTIETADSTVGYELLPATRADLVCDGAEILS